ncbi:hypothetical protein B0H10DRAFT_1959424 [Mycena sp. CBHHK59/15]|nr:hypothetical protein B0H10DRAFT_1959424 [Mycena sp. CBHHK59/15]
MEYHPILDGTPCDTNGYDLPPNSLPPPWEEQAPDDYSPFNGRAEFEFAEYLYRDEEMAGQRINCLSQLLAALYKDMDPHLLITKICTGDVPWQSFSVTYTGPLPESGEVPAWMTEKYEVWFRSARNFEKQLANPDFKDEMDWAPKRIFKGERSDKIAKDENTHGAMFVPRVLGSDKTTGLSGREIQSFTHYTAVSETFTTRHGVHIAMAFGNGLSVHSKKRPFPRVIYGLGPYIADYPEQVLLTSIVQGWCPRCLSPATDLDRPSVSRSHEHTDVLMEGCTLKELWDDFGILFHSPLVFPAQISTN